MRDLITQVTALNLGCTYAGTIINLLAYANDMVVLAPSWQALQSILVVIEDAASKISMSFNTKKTVCMVFNPCDKRRIICDTFPQFTLAGCKLRFVEHFRYLGHIIVVVCLMTRRLKICSLQVKSISIVSYLLV